MPAAQKTIGQINSNVFTAIAHPVRRQILAALAHGDVTAGELAEPFAISRSAISQHLTILLASDLVAVEKRGREHYYQIRPTNLNEVYRWVKQFEHFWTEKLDALEIYLDEEYLLDESDSEL